MHSGRDQSVQVLIVGGGPVGLALAIELGHRGVNALLVERNERVGYAPRAKTTNVRTREHLRRWGIAQDLAAASPLGIHYPSNIVFCTRLAGHFLTRIDNAAYNHPGRFPLYAEHAQWIPQYTLEEVLRRHASTLPGVRLQFSTELVGFEQDAEGVTAIIRDRKQATEQAVRCQYLVGADGSRSRVRDGIGARMEGVANIARHYNVVFRAPGLDRAHTFGPAIMYWQVNPDVPSLLGPMDRDNRWFFMPVQIPEGKRFSDAEMAALIGRATGLQFPLEILSSDEWIASRLVADRYRAGRVFLAGDACHLHPPFGGHGMNMGVGDAVDLGWKLAATIQGWGGAGLLESYQTERRPVHQWVIEEAVANHALLSDRLGAPGMEESGAQGEALRQDLGRRIQSAKIREFCTLGVSLGYRYEDSPIVVGDGSRAPARDFVNYVPSAHPGCRAPHAWLHDGSSLYDHLGPGFSLLVTDAADPDDAAPLEAEARRLGIPLAVVRPDLPVLADLYQARYALIRPDQHVAWRADRIDRPGDLLSRVTGRR
jgi:2-polyprenyl-6-methoxyphenol hydroxylase-like FAD-dependent oxidoreductase